MRKLAILFGSAALAVTTILAPQASALSQGDKVVNSYGNSCTVGYINHETNQAYISRHCASGDGKFYHNGQHVGTMDPSTPGFRLISSYPGMFPHDSGKMNLHAGQAGDNNYSGNNKASHHVAPGTQVCSYGQTTGRTTCGIALSSTPTDLYVLNMALPGDSGGPNWTSDGFVGTTTGGGLGYRVVKNEY